MNPTLAACGATLTLASTHGERTVAVATFFLGYRKVTPQPHPAPISLSSRYISPDLPVQVDLRPGELIKSIRVPHPKPFEFLAPYKQARRREDDISIVTGCLRVRDAGGEGPSAPPEDGAPSASPDRPKARPAPFPPPLHRMEGYT